MKRILHIMLVAVVSMIGFAAWAQGAASIKFPDKIHNFGTINEADGPVTCEFSFTNTGDAPLIIISAAAGCGCTRPEYSTEPIAPGKKGVIKVTYNPSGRPGEFTKNVNVRTNDKKNKKVVLQISGIVIPKQ